MGAILLYAWPILSVTLVIEMAVIVPSFPFRLHLNGCEIAMKAHSVCGQNHVIPKRNVTFSYGKTISHPLCIGYTKHGDTLLRRSDGDISAQSIALHSPPCGLSGQNSLKIIRMGPLCQPVTIIFYNRSPTQ